MFCDLRVKLQNDLIQMDMLKLKNLLNKIIFLDKPVFVRIWMWSAIICLIYYFVVALSTNRYVQNERDIYVMAYGLASTALYILIYGFDWKK